MRAQEEGEIVSADEGADPAPEFDAEGDSMQD